MPKRRTCADRERLVELRSLRRWFAEVRATPNDGRRERVVLRHATVESGEFDYGWSSWARFTLRDGREIVCGGPGRGRDLPVEVAARMYSHLSRELRKSTKERSY